MFTSVPWKRFWCRREDPYSLGDRGFLSDPESENGKLLNPKLISFDRLQQTLCVALLGEPGVGKSWSLQTDVDAYLRQASNVSALRLDLRSVGSEDRLQRKLFDDPTFKAWEKGEHELHLFLDSLDECLLQLETVAAVLADELPLYPLERMKLRIACRTATWPALLEHALVKRYGREHFIAAELVPLRRKDVVHAACLSGISIPELFLGQIDELQIAALAVKPVTLGFLVNTFIREGALPSSVLDLYEKGCGILCEEQNESRRASGRIGNLSPRDRVAVASRIAAATQLANRYAVWTGIEATDVPAEDVTIGDLSGETESGDTQISVSNAVIRETLGTGLFSSRGKQRMGWSHQTYAEFLAARYCIWRRFSIQQLRSLLFHPRRSRLIPQVRAVASWLAIQHEELFAAIAESQPEALLGNASANLSDKQRFVVTNAIIKSCEQSQSLHVDSNLPLRNLAHSRLDEQLRPIITDASRPFEARYLAVKIAWQCGAEGLVDILTKIALSEDESRELRIIAEYAIAAIGTQNERNNLRPLLATTPEKDPDDQLRGAALQAVYPKDVYDDEMWSYLDHPRDSLYFGAYHSFLTYTVPPKLNATNICAALRWSAKQGQGEIGPVAEVQQAIFFLGFEHIEEEDVVAIFANAVLARLHSGRPIERGGRSKGFSEQLAKNRVRRRKLLEALFPLLKKENCHFLLHPMPLLCAEDFDWLLKRVQYRSPTIPTEVEWAAIDRLARSWDRNIVETLRQACQQDPIIAQRFQGFFDAWPLDSAENRPTRKSREDLLRENNIQVAPAVLPRCEAALARVSSGDVDAWCTLLGEMSVDEGGTHYLNFRQMEVEKLPGWIQASQDLRGRIIEAAKTFLTTTSFRSNPWFPSNRVPNGAYAATNAFVLLNATEPNFLGQQLEDFWSGWIPSLLADSRTHYENDEAAKAIFKMAALAAPTVIATRLVEQIDYENGEHKYLACARLIDLGWSEVLNAALLVKLQGDDLSPGVQGDIAYRLIKHGSAGTKAWVEKLLRDNYQGERASSLAQALLKGSKDSGWSVLWPIIQADAAFGRALLENVSYGTLERTSFTTSLTDVELGDLYIWLVEQYPPQNDRRAAGEMGPLDTIKFVRDGVLGQLKQRATFEACDSLARAELKLPQHRWLRYHFDEAEELACASTWKAPSPRDLLTMARDSGKRFVESSKQLLEVVKESLYSLQIKLHDDLGAVCDLWNAQKDNWCPKEEEAISEYVARHLRDDLGERGIIINREVQIRRGRRGEMSGQNTDIHVDVGQPSRSSSTPYGPISVVVEVKGSWNEGLMKDMETQLRDRYLKNSGCRTGLYLVAHFQADRWVSSDWRRLKSEARRLEALRSELQQQASELSGAVHIESFVIDARLDSAKASVEPNC